MPPDSPHYRNRTAQLTSAYRALNDYGRVLQRCDASLARTDHSPYVGGADGLNLRLCRVQLPGAAPVPLLRRVVPAYLPILHSQRSARLTRRRLPARVATLMTGDCSCKAADHREPARAHCAALALPATIRWLRQRQDTGGAFAATLELDGPTLDAPDCIAERDQ